MVTGQWVFANGGLAFILFSFYVSSLYSMYRWTQEMMPRQRGGNSPCLQVENKAGVLFKESRFGKCCGLCQASKR